MAGSFVLAVLGRPGADPPPPVMVPANPDGSPPATVLVAQPAAMLRRGERTTFPREADRRPAIPADVYQLTTLAPAAAAFDQGSAQPGVAQPGAAWPGDPGPAVPAPSITYTYAYRATTPAWS